MFFGEHAQCHAAAGQCQQLDLYNVCILPKVEDEMIQCVVCEDWFHSRVSHILSFCSNNHVINFSTYKARPHPRMKRWCVMRAWNHMTFCGLTSCKPHPQLWRRKIRALLQPTRNLLPLKWQEVTNQIPVLGLGMSLTPATASWSDSESDAVPFSVAVTTWGQAFSTKAGALNSVAVQLVR